MSCTTSNGSRIHQVGLNSQGCSPRGIQLEKRNQPTGLGLIYKHFLKENKKTRGDQALSRFFLPGVSCPVLTGLLRITSSLTGALNNTLTAFFLQRSLFSLAETSFLSAFSSGICNALTFSLQSIWHLWTAVMDGMYLLDIKKQAGLIKWCMVRLRHSNCLLYHEDVWSLGLTVMNPFLLRNDKCTERQGHAVRSPHWCHQQLTNCMCLLFCSGFAWNGIQK